MSLLKEKFKEVSVSVLPITILVIILHLTLVPIEGDMLGRFILGSLLVILGLGIFLLGVELGVTPIGNLMGETIAKSNKILIVVISSFILGFLVTVAEPSVIVLSNQINQASGGIIPATTIQIVISIGFGTLAAVGFLRILFDKPLNVMFTIIYGTVFLLGAIISEEFFAISVDSGAASTGAMTTPFILALGYGVSQLKGGKNVEENSFGMVGAVTSGPIFAVMIMSILSGVTNIQGEVEAFVPNTGVLSPYVKQFAPTLKETALALSPIIFLFIIFNVLKFKLSKKNRNNILKGLLYTYIGLSLFLTGVNAGFMEVGRIVAYRLGSLEHNWVLLIVGFVLGLIVVLAEPAVHVLTEQVEEVTSGYIKRQVIRIALSIAIAGAVSGTMLRIMVPKLKLWHFLLPGYIIALYLSYKVPPLFVGIAFDSGAVASGPLTATFVLAFAQGAADAIPTANVLVDGFGVIAMVAMTPLVTVQILGYLFKLKAKKEGIDLNDPIRE